MTKVKICGIRSMGDIDIVNELMPDFVGVVFAESKRKVTPTYGALLLNHLDPRIKKVGVFFNQSPEYVTVCRNACDLDIIQLHGDEDLDAYNFEQPIWKAIRVKEASDLDNVSKLNTDFILTDAFDPELPGGTGKTVPKDILKKIEGKKHILAGGLNAENVNDYIEMFNPFCVDVSSALEVDGFKDMTLAREFVEAVRNDTKK